MSHTILHTKIKTARKQYICNGCLHMLDGYGIRELANDRNLTFKEKRTLVKIKNEHYKVLPGSKYIEQVGVMDNTFYCVQSRFDAYEICNKYDLWMEY